MTDRMEAMAEDLVFDRELKDRYFDAAHDAVVVVDEDRVIHLVNRAAEMLFGYHRSELRGQPIEILVPESRREVHKEHTAKYVEAPRMRPMGAALELKARKKNGTEFPVEINLSPEPTVRGVFTYATVRTRG